MENNNNILDEIMINQPIINIGMVGHVANGKSSITKALTGISTQKYASEKQKNITIKLGYANGKIYQCPLCKAPECYQSSPSHQMNKNCQICNSEMKLITHFSLIDCPGHVKFMSTMLNGTNIMDTTILVEAINNETIPAPQTVEHINALTVGNIPNSIICLNKFDLIKSEYGLKKIKIFQEKLKNTVAEHSAIIPVAATFGINIDILCEYIAQIPKPIRNIESPVKMIVVRSFNINKPGTKITDMCGGVIGGSILYGKINIGMDIELYPGYTTRNELNTSRWKYKPLRAKILSINSETNKLEFAIPGGLIGIQLDIDPALTANDKLIGQMLMPLNSGDVYENITVLYKPLNNTINLKINDKLHLNINACNISGEIQEINIDNSNPEIEKLNLKLEKPICVAIKDKVTILYDKKICGTSVIIDGIKSELN